MFETESRCNPNWLQTHKFPQVACPHTLLIILTPEGRKSERSQAPGKIKVRSCTPGSSGRASLLSSPSGQPSSVLCRWMVQAAGEASPSASRGLDVCSPLPLAWQWQPSQTMQTPGAPHPPPMLYWGWGGEDLWESSCCITPFSFEKDKNTWTNVSSWVIYSSLCVWDYCKGFWNLNTNIHTYNLEWGNFKRNMMWLSGVLTEVLSKSLILWLTSHI